MKQIAGSSHYSVDDKGQCYQGKHPVPMVVKSAKDDKGNLQFYAPSDAHGLEGCLRPVEIGGKGFRLATESDVLVLMRAVNETERGNGRAAKFPGVDKPESSPEVKTSGNPPAPVAVSK